MFSTRAFLLLNLFTLSWAQGLGVGDDTDHGPFTFSYCDQGIDSCKTACAKDANPVYRADVKDQFPDYQLSMSQDELQRYHSLQQEYLTAFLEKPMWNESTTALPYCGTASSIQSRLLRRDRPDWDQEVTVDKDSKSSSKPNCIPDTITATVSFNVVTTNYSTNLNVTDDIVNKQFLQLQAAYEPLGISFQKGVVLRHMTPDWRSIAQNVTAQTVDDLRSVIGGIRRGGYDQLNVFIVEKVGDISCDGNTITRTDGFCTYPEDNDNKYDGCFIDIDSLPGTSWLGKTNGTGETLVHEVGHWFGLRHVYDSEATDNSCHAPDSFYVNTPALSGQGSYDAFQTQCCADDKGNFTPCDQDHHHVTNWMSYSDDRGVTDSANHTYPWTEGQRAAMFASFYYFRRGTDKIKCANGDSMYTESVKTDGNQITGLAQDLLSQPINLLGTLKKLCADSFNGKSYQIDAITGDIVDNPSGWNKLGAWRWVIIAIVVVAALVLVMGCCLFFLRKKGKAGRTSSYNPLMGGGRHELQQRRGLKDMITVQTRSADLAAEPYRPQGGVAYHD